MIHDHLPSPMKNADLARFALPLGQDVVSEVIQRNQQRHPRINFLAQERYGEFGANDRVSTGIS
jgi:hypothetical protein